MQKIYQQFFSWDCLVQIQYMKQMILENYDMFTLIADGDTIVEGDSREWGVTDHHLQAEM